LDIEMPEMNGFEAIAKLKEHPDHKDIPVMFLTGYIDDEIKTRSFESGALDVMLKSDTGTTLLKRIKEII